MSENTEIVEVKQELNLKSIFEVAFKDGFKNILSLGMNILLWALTCWVPYINIGTTIGLACLPAKLGRGESLSLVEIFDPIYRKKWANTFL